MQLMGPCSQERELPVDNCHCWDPIKKSLPTPPPHSLAWNYERTLAITSLHYKPHNGIIKTAFLPPWVEQFSQQSNVEWFPVWSLRAPFSISIPESSSAAMLMVYPRQRAATLRHRKPVFAWNCGGEVTPCGEQDSGCAALKAAVTWANGYLFLIV